MKMGKIRFRKLLGCLCFSQRRGASVWMDTAPLEKSEGDQKVQLLIFKESIAANQTSVLQLTPKEVMLKVSMHCKGCARKVEKHISKLEGVISYKVDLESKRVVVVGHITELEVLGSISKVKNAELWISPS